jgi:hypothetical protein
MYNTVWAIGDEQRQGQAELCHSTAVGKTVECLNTLVRQADGFPPGGKNGPVFAIFQSGYVKDRSRYNGDSHCEVRQDIPRAVEESPDW